MAGKGRRSLKINKVICGQCHLDVKDEDEFIQCDKCKKNFHVVCTQLDKPKYEYLLKHESEEYACHLCDTNNNNNSGTITKELNEIKAELKKLDQLSVLAESLSFMSKQFDELMKGVAENKKKLEVVQKENTMLKNEVVSLKTSIKLLNDHRVKNDCIISGIVAPKGQSAVDTVLKLSSDAEVELQPDYVEDAYFMDKRNKPDKKDEKKVIVVKFNSKKAKDKFMSIKPKLREKESTVFVNDFLSRETLNLLNYAKSLKNVGYRVVYAAGGKIFCKRHELARPKIIRCKEDVDDLLLEATTNKPRSRRLHISTMEDVDDVHISS